MWRGGEEEMSRREVGLFVLFPCVWWLELGRGSLARLRHSVRNNNWMIANESIAIVRVLYTLPPMHVSTAPSRGVT